jgi:copper chaperone CopZ
MHCGHCEAAVKRELGRVDGVDAVDVDLETKRVAVSGDALNSSALVSAIDEAGFDAEEVAA